MTTKTNNAPDYIVYSIPPKGPWTNIGVAFNNRQGKGINVVLNCFPLDGKVTLQPYEPKAATPEDSR